MKNNTNNLISRNLGRCAFIAATIVPAIATADEVMTSFDAWSGTGGAQTSNTGFVATYALTGSLYKSGFRAIGGISDGKYSYSDTASPSGRIQGRYADIFAQVGYNFAGPMGSLTLAAGPTVVSSLVSFQAPGGPTSGEKRGIRTSLTGYMPVGKSGYVVGVGFHSSADQSNYYMVKMGFDVRDGLNFGPEASIAKGRNYNERRLGVHLTGFTVGKIILGLSAGRRQDQDNRHGGYIQVSARATF